MSVNGWIATSVVFATGFCVMLLSAFRFLSLWQKAEQELNDLRRDLMEANLKADKYVGYYRMYEECLKGNRLVKEE